MRNELKLLPLNDDVADDKENMPAIISQSNKYHQTAAALEMDYLTLPTMEAGEKLVLGKNQTSFDNTQTNMSSSMNNSRTAVHTGI